MISSSSPFFLLCFALPISRYAMDELLLFYDRFLGSRDHRSNKQQNATEKGTTETSSWEIFFQSESYFWLTHVEIELLDDASEWDCEISGKSSFLPLWKNWSWSDFHDLIPITGVCIIRMLRKQKKRVFSHETHLAHRVQFEVAHLYSHCISLVLCIEFNHSNFSQHFNGDCLNCVVGRQLLADSTQ